MGRFQKFVADYNLLTPDDMDELLYTPFEIAMGEFTVERLQRQFENYEYYSGKQHRNENGELVRASELQRPAGLDYDPTRYATNYFKAIINRKARWQMGGKHSVTVPRKKVIDEDGSGAQRTATELAEGKPEGQPTPANGDGLKTKVDASETQDQPIAPNVQTKDPKQIEADRIADGHEKIIQQLWRENKMRSKLIQAARDRLIADRVVAKIVFNPNTGKLRWLFRPDTEFFPVYSDDDFEELIACHFIRQMMVEDGDEEVEAFRKQTFTLEGEGESRQCYVEEAIYTAEDLEVYEQIQPKTPMAISFIPVVPFEVSDLLAEDARDSEISNLREQNDVLNQMNEDAIDSLKFEMFSMTAVINAPEGTADQMRVAPGAVLEARGFQDGQNPSIKKVESGFKWGGVFKDQYMRVKAAMHEVSGLPQVVPQELNFGGLNGDALQILFHDIISDTEEHWLTWEHGLQELHEKSIKYLQARTGESNFNYDKEIVSKVTDYETEIKFVLPLPDNRKELVELLTDEMTGQLESQSGALKRLGVEDIKAKQDEINREFLAMQQSMDPYAEAEDVRPSGGPPTPQAKEAEKIVEDGGTPRNDNGEEVGTCNVCGGSGKVISTADSKIIECMNCRGDGVVQVRKR
ncbi:phage portal protein [Rossellomorea marisflavi]|uniref:phage portal protein n=1 Tax=Rossellomorea marisflavi TaxID=189381 RepID=UPI0009A62C00|nr:phage portal protein [Rossellomorea marisflavi]